MTLTVEEGFPRGGTKRKFAENVGKQHRQENLFSVSALDSKKTKTKKNKKERAKEKNAAQLDAVVDAKATYMLTYAKIEEDMVILGCVRLVTSLSIEIELPGRTYGVLWIRSISDEFTNHLNQLLEQEEELREGSELTRLNAIFKVGQFVPVKVMGRTEEGNKVKVNLSMKPSDLNAGKTYRNFHNGMLLWASVVEKSDHCYMLSAGVSNCRVILPFKNIAEGTCYVDGQPLWCVVAKCQILKEASTITVSTLPEDINSQVEPASASLNYMLPGTQVDVTVEKVLKDGLQGKFLQECSCYINQAYFSKPFGDLSNFKETQPLQARILYVQPTTNITYLTLRSLEEVEQPQFQIGGIINATVVSKAGKGLVVRLGESEEKGFVPYRRIVRSLTKEDSDLEELIHKKYSKQSTHKCRVLDYNRLDQMYICTFEASVLKEKFFCRDDLTPGQVVQGDVVEMNRFGIVVQLGRMQGFVPNLHLSNVAYSENIKKKFAVGQKLKAKVLAKPPGQLVLTLKPAMLESDLCLSRYEKVDLTKQYPGVVIQASSKGVLVLFYADLKGWIRKEEFSQEGMDSIKNMFYLGQVILVTPTKVTNNKMTLSLQPPKPAAVAKKMHLKVGNVVSDITSNSLSLHSVNLLCQYFAGIDDCKAKCKNDDLTLLSIGQPVLCTIDQMGSEGGCTLSLRNGVKGIVNVGHCPKEIQEGTVMKGVILWIDYIKEYIEVSLSPKYCSSIHEQCENNDPLLALRSTSAEVLVVNKNFVLCMLTAKECHKQLIYLPVRLHENDFNPDYSIYTRKTHKKIKVDLCKSFNGKLIGMSKKVNRRLERQARANTVFKLKIRNDSDNQKKSESATSDVDEEEIALSNSNESQSEDGSSEAEDDAVEIAHAPSRKRKTSEVREFAVQKQVKKPKQVDELVTTPKIITTPLLSGMGDFYNENAVVAASLESSEDESDQETQVKEKKKKKLTAVERNEVIRLEEVRLRKIESELADSTAMPQSADHFDRMLLGDPDNSELWARYIAFHVEATEIEKARAIAQKALEKINPTKSQERLNVWLALLNLENLYGNAETYEKTFEEACRCNDDLKIYLESIKMLADLEKHNEMENKIKKCREKFKQQPAMWIEIGRVYYQSKRFEDARKMQTRAVSTLQDKKSHIGVLVQYANMEFSLGVKTEGEALFETILQNYPARTDAWSNYVDQLVKKNDLDLARKVLGRAVSQKLHFKKMQVLYKKYMRFAKTHGDEAEVQAVNELLQEFIKQHK